MTTVKELEQKAVEIQKIMDRYLPAPRKVVGISPIFDRIGREMM